MYLIITSVGLRCEETDLIWCYTDYIACRSLIIESQRIVVPYHTVGVRSPLPMDISPGASDSHTKYSKLQLSLDLEI